MTKTPLRTLGCAVAVAAALASPSARAGLNGDTVNLTWSYFGTTIFTRSDVVGPEVELLLGGPQSIDYGDDFIEYRPLGGGPGCPNGSDGTSAAKAFATSPPSRW